MEEYLRNQVRKMGGRAYKFESTGNNGVPDRLVLLPGGILFFIETKKPGEKARKLQEVQIARIRKYGQIAEVLDTKEKIDNFLSKYKRSLGG